MIELTSEMLDTDDDIESSKLEYLAHWLASQCETIINTISEYDNNETAIY